MDFFSPKIGIIVLNYNGQDCLLPCLQSLARLEYSNFFVVVVDNNSHDDSLQRAKQAFPHFHFLTLADNFGFAGGMNRGIKMAQTLGAEWVWLFNNDARVEADALKYIGKVIQKSQAEKIGAISPVVLQSESGKIWFEKGKIDWIHMRVRHVSANASERKLDYYKSEFLTGCALLFPIAAYKSIGGLDEAFFLYYEDADYTFRLRKAGLASVVVPKARVFHAEKSIHNPEKLYFLVLSGLIFFFKHATFFYRQYLTLYVTIRRIKNSIDIWRGRDEAQSVQRAYRDFFHDH